MFQTTSIQTIGGALANKLRQKITVRAIVFVLLFVLALPALAEVVELCFESMMDRQTVTGHLPGQSDKGYTAGIFKVKIDGVTQYGFCTDLNNTISTGKCYKESQVGAASPLVSCTMQFYPPQPGIGNQEAAARQLAVWHFSDGFTGVSPAATVTRAQAIIDDITQKNANGECNPVENTTLKIDPASAVNFLISDGNGGYEQSDHTYTITVKRGGSPLAGVQVNVSTDLGSLDNDQVTTDENGQAEVTVSHNQPGIAKITASMVVAVPAGTRIDPGSKTQKIILGGTQEQTISDTATKEWVAGGKVVVKKFHDVNRDGVFNGTDSYIDWQIQYRAVGTSTWTKVNLGSDGSATIAVGTTKTYEFCEIEKSGWLRTVPAQSNCYTDVQAPAELVFGNVKLSSLVIHKYHDLNANGIREEGEEGLDNWSFDVRRKQNGIWVSSYSGSTYDGGLLGFSGLENYEYQVSEYVKSGWYVSTANPQTFVANNGVYDLEFGNFRPASLTVNKTWLLNGQEVNPPDATALVCIMRLGNPVPFSPADGNGAALTANEDGYFCQTLGASAEFTKLWPGEYAVKEISPAGWTGPNATDNVVLLSGDEKSVEITNSRRVDDDGEERGKLIVFKYEDKNTNGKFDGDDMGLGGWTFIIKGEAGSFEVTTGENGYGEIILPAGEYEICEVLTDGWMNTDPGTEEACKTVTVTAGGTGVDNPGPMSVILTIPDDRGSTYEVKLVSHTGNSWTYEVTQLDATNSDKPTRDLSHWVLGLTCDADAIISSDPTYNDLGKDGNRPFSGVKWETGGGVGTDGTTFTITLDKDYPETTIGVLVKSGDNAYAIGDITGPDCDDEPTNPEPVFFGNARKPQLGKLIITKYVDWKDFPVDQNQTFVICITGPSFESIDVEGACQETDYDGGELVWNNLLIGGYSITEQDPGTGWTVEYSGDGIVTIEPNGQHTRYITNTHDPLPRGSVEVTKKVDWADVTPDENQTFTICLIDAQQVEDCKTFDYDGGTLTWDNLLYGSYTVMEKTGDLGDVWTVSGDQGIMVNVNGEGTPSATIVNTHDPLPRGSLKVIKVINWSNAQPTDVNFRICVIGPSHPDGWCNYVTNPDGGMLEWNDLLLGEYQVWEEEPGSDWTVIGNGQKVEVTVEGATVTITNTHKEVITCSSDPSGLTGYIKRMGGTAWGYVTNNNEEAFCGKIGLVSYLKYDENIDNQVGYTFVNPEVRIEPGQTYELHVDLPECSTQVDLFHGDVIWPTFGGRRYHREGRLLAAAHYRRSGYCVMEEVEDESHEPMTQALTIIEEPQVDEPIIDEPVIEEPQVDEPLIDEPIIEEPQVDEPVIEEPQVDEEAPADETSSDETEETSSEETTNEEEGQSEEETTE